VWDRLGAADQIWMVGDAVRERAEAPVQIDVVGDEATPPTKDSRPTRGPAAEETRAARGVPAPRSPDPDQRWRQRRSTAAPTSSFVSGSTGIGRSILHKCSAPFRSSRFENERDLKRDRCQSQPTLTGWKERERHQIARTNSGPTRSSPISQSGADIALSQSSRVSHP
jgi:hypothetical protein